MKALIKISLLAYLCTLPFSQAYALGGKRPPPNTIESEFIKQWTGKKRPPQVLDNQAQSRWGGKKWPPLVNNQ